MKRFAEGGERKKKMMTAAAGALLLALIALLFLNSMTADRDGRSSIIAGEKDVIYDDAGKTEEEVRLENILECIAGVGKARVMIRSGEKEQTASVFLTQEKDFEETGRIEGVIVAAEGADNPVVQSKITEAVATVCGVPFSSVAVYPMSQP